MPSQLAQRIHGFFLNKIRMLNELMNQRVNRIRIGKAGKAGRGLPANSRRWIVESLDQLIVGKGEAMAAHASDGFFARRHIAAARETAHRAITFRRDAAEILKRFSETQCAG